MWYGPSLPLGSSMQSVGAAAPADCPLYMHSFVFVFCQVFCKY